MMLHEVKCMWTFSTLKLALVKFSVSQEGRNERRSRENESVSEASREDHRSPFSLLDWLERRATQAS